MITWLLKLVLPRADRNVVLGDLAEESALHQNPNRWVRKQVLRSIPPIVRQNIRRGVWLKTLGAALLGYVVVTVLVITSTVIAGVIAGLTMPTESAAIETAMSLIFGFGAALAAGYVAAWMRPSAAKFLTVIVAVMGLVSLRVTGDQAPLGYQLALIVIGPVAALAGGKIRTRKRRDA